MRLTRALCLCLIVVLHGMPITAGAQATARTFALPAGRVSEQYQVSIPLVLRDTYRLKLVQDGAPSPDFRWGLVTGELPDGLELSPDGVIMGRPSIFREQPYRFRVVATAIPDQAISDPIDFSLSVTGPRVKLVKINSPRLVPSDAADGIAGEAEQAAGSLFTAGSPDSGATSRLGGATGAPSPQRGSAAPCTLPAEFVPPAGTDVITVDVPRRTALRVDKNNVTHAVNLDDEQEFGRGEVVRIVYDNKNPYMYQTKYTREQRSVTEPAIATFLAALGGVVADFMPAPPKEEAKAKDAPTAPANAPSTALPLDPCAEARGAVQQLNAEIERAAQTARQIEESLGGVKDAADKLAKVYQKDRDALYVFGKKREDLYCDSVKLLADTENGIGDANARTLADAQKKIRVVKNMAETVPARVDFIKSNYPADCLDEASLLRVRLYARGLSDAADGYQKTVNEINSVVDKVEKSREVVRNVLKDPRNFFEVHAEGGGKSTKTVATKLELTPVKDVAEAKAVDPVTLNLKFGEAPYFSLSGGLVFSGLRRVEFQRVQGFELDRQGNLVLTDGKPNLTTVVGLKEGSPTRLLPMIMLHGRLPGTSRGVLDGVHATLGLTAKNDGKGTDPEFLLGPTFSFLENNIFFTAGGYLGRQQRLEGSLFPGAAVPSTVTDIPIRKDYRWNFGFAVTYRLPINKPSGAK